MILEVIYISFVFQYPSGPPTHSLKRFIVLSGESRICNAASYLIQCILLWRPGWRSNVSYALTTPWTFGLCYSLKFK